METSRQNTESTPDGPTEKSAAPLGALVIIILGVSLIVLDGTIVSVSLPAIIRDLGLNLTEAQWVTSLYTVVFAALLMPMGSLGDRYGRRKIFLVGLAIFGLASILAAVASSAFALIAARGLQGIGGAMVLPSTLSTINAIFRGKERALAFGMWGATMASMAAIGPLLGGWITTSFTWPWVFIVNVPVVAILIPLALRSMPETKSDEVNRVDIGGAALSAVAFGAVVFGLIEAANYGWWAPKKLLQIGGMQWPDVVSFSTVILLIGLALVIVFVVVQARRKAAGKHVLIDVTLFKIPSFTRGNIAAATVAIGEFGILFSLPLYLVNVLDLSTMGSGWVLAALAFGAVLSGAGARHLTALVGPATTVVIGLALEVVGIAMAAIILSPEVSPWALALILAVYGLGAGLASAQLASVVLMQVPVERSGMASAMQSTFRQVGSAIGVAVAGTVLSISLHYDLPARLTQAGIPPQAADAITDGVVDSAGGAMKGIARGNSEVIGALHEGFSLGIESVLWVSCVFLGVGLIAALMLPRTAETRQETADGAEQSPASSLN